MNKHLPLIIGIALPVVFILIISLIVFIPSFFINPQYNFLYSTNNSYYAYDQQYKNNYVVQDNKLTLQPATARPDQVFKGDNPSLYLYDVKTNSSHEINLTDAEKYVIDPGPSSPDGYIVQYEYNSEGIFDLFGSSGNNSGYFMEKGTGKKRLNGLIQTDRYYQGSFKLIGWIK